MAKEARGEGLHKAERQEVGDQTTMTKLAGLFEAVHRPLNPEEAEPLSGRVGLDEGKEEKTRQNCGG